MDVMLENEVVEVGVAPEPWVYLGKALALLSRGDDLSTPEGQHARGIFTCALGVFLDLNNGDINAAARDLYAYFPPEVPVAVIPDGFLGLFRMVELELAGGKIIG